MIVRKTSCYCSRTVLYTFTKQERFKMSLKCSQRWGLLCLKSSRVEFSFLFCWRNYWMHGVVVRAIHAGRLRLWKSSARDGRIENEGKCHTVNTGDMRHVWSSGVGSSGRQTLGGLSVYLQRGDNYGWTSDVSCLRHFFFQVNLHLCRFLQRLYWLVLH